MAGLVTEGLEVLIVDFGRFVSLLAGVRAGLEAIRAGLEVEVLRGDPVLLRPGLG